MTSACIASRALRCFGSLIFVFVSATPSFAVPFLIFNGTQPNDPGPPAGGLSIADNGAMDTDPAAGIIRFNSAAGGGAGFVLPQGFVVSGTVKTGGGGALAGVANLVNIVSLTDLEVLKPGGGRTDQLLINFGETFLNPAAPVDAADGFEGQFLNAGGKVGSGIIALRGSVNGTRIGGVDVAAAVDVASPSNFKRSDVMRGIGGGPPWLLRGELTINLGIAGDRLLLPGSAEVGIGPAKVPEPSTLTLFGVAAVALGMVRRHGRRPR